MTTTRNVWAALAAAALLIVTLLAAVTAEARDPRQSGEGTGMITGFEQSIVRDVGGNSHEVRVVEGIVTGSLTGSFRQETTGTVHTNHPDNLVTFRGVLVFTGTIEGCGPGEHTIVLGLSGRGTVPDPGFPLTEAKVRAINQPANTLAIIGTGTVTQEGPFLSYEVTYRCP